jgi:NlpC/P60 family protein
MRYGIRLLLLSMLMCVALAAQAQTPKLRFLDLSEPDTPVAGSVRLRVDVEDTAGQKDVRAAIYVDNRVLLVGFVPCSYRWDTHKVANGEHVLRLCWIDPSDESEHEVARATVMVENRDAQPVTPRTNAPGELGETSRTARAPTWRVLTRMRPKEQKAETFAAAKPLATIASALHVAGKTLYIGLPDGGITLYDRAKGKATTVHPAQAAGRTQRIFTGEDTVWWLAEDDPAALGSNQPNAPAGQEIPARWLFAYREKAGTVTAYDLQEGEIYGKLRRCAGWQGQVALFADAGGGILDPETGEVLSLDAGLPDAALGTAQNPIALYLITDELGAVLVAANTQPRRDPMSDVGRSLLHVAVWRGQGKGWRDAGAYDLPVEEGYAYTTFAVTSEHLFMRRSGVLTDVKLSGASGTVTTLPAASVTGANNEPLLAGGNQCWMLEGNALFHGTPEKQSQERLLPWNEPGLETRAAAADRDGIWLATNRDVRWLSLAKPDPQKGYGGFIRVPLGEATTRPTTEADRKMAGLVADWQGVPYKWGGSTKTGTDCSGFVMAVHQSLGINLPHGTEFLRNCAGGAIVHDTLRYGDVLVYPGHCAIYLGDGKTAETVDTGVSYAGIWSRDQVVVRRFINTQKPAATHKTAGNKKHGKKN